MSTTKFVGVFLLGLIIGAGGVYGFYYLQQPPPPVTVELWTSFLGESDAEDFWDWFAAYAAYRYPNITVEVTHWTGQEYNTKLTTAFAGGTPPDMYISYGGGDALQYIDEDHVYDLTAFMNESWARAQVPQSYRSTFTFYDKIWGMPWELNIGGIIANPKLFAEAGITLPDASLGESWNISTFFDVCNTLNASGFTPLAVSGGATRHQVHLMDYFIERKCGQTKFLDTLLRETGNAFNDTCFVEAFEYLEEMQQNATSWFQVGWETDGYGDCIGVMEANTTAMWVLYSWPVTSMESASGITFEYLPFPHLPGGYGGASSAAYTNGICVANASDNLEAALDVLRLHAEPEVVRKYAVDTGSAVAHVVAFEAGTFDGWIGQALDFYAMYSPAPVIRKGTFAPATWASKYEEVTGQLLAGLLTPQEACDALEQSASEL
jgi:raffinose/stachyose/melibiose transport system substrate-binding protein